MKDDLCVPSFHWRTTAERLCREGLRSRAEVNVKSPSFRHYLEMTIDDWVLRLFLFSFCDRISRESIKTKRTRNAFAGNKHKLSTWKDNLVIIFFSQQFFAVLRRLSSMFFFFFLHWRFSALTRWSVAEREFLGARPRRRKTGARIANLHGFLWLYVWVLSCSKLCCILIRHEDRVFSLSPLQLETVLVGTYE